MTFGASRGRWHAADARGSLFRNARPLQRHCHKVAWPLDVAASTQSRRSRRVAMDLGERHRTPLKPDGRSFKTVIPKTGNAFPDSAANRADDSSLDFLAVAAVM